MKTLTNETIEKKTRTRIDHFNLSHEFDFLSIYQNRDCDWKTGGFLVGNIDLSA